MLKLKVAVYNFRFSELQRCLRFFEVWPFLALDLPFPPQTLKNGFLFSEFFSFLKPFR